MSVDLPVASYTESASRVLDVAERMVQERGFNAFSYADIAAELGVTKPSVHYHFATKTDLGLALVTRYTARLAESLHDLDALPALDRLRGYAALYRAVLERRRMCLCGMLAAEFGTLPDAMRSAVLDFFTVNERWLQSVLTDGQTDGSLRVRRGVEDTARMIIDCLEGAVLIARPYADLARFDRVADAMIATLDAG